MNDENKINDVPRIKSLYWVSGNKVKSDLLIFDGGDEFGKIHVYEIKESFTFQDVKREMKELVGLKEDSEPTISMVVPSWIEHKYGYPSMSYKLEP